MSGERRQAVQQGLNTLAHQQIAQQTQEFDDIPWEELKEWTKLPPLKEGEEVPGWRRRLEEPEGWRECPLFIEGELSDDAGEKNPQIAALQDLLYNDMSPDELAERCKSSGNQCMQQAQEVLSGRVAPGTAGPRGGWRTALSFYTEGIHAKPDDQDVLASLLSNRAQAHLNLENYGHCVADCQDALRIRNDVKCCFRAAKACSAVKKPDRALQFVHRGLSFPGEGGNQALLKLQKAARKMIEEQRDADRQRFVAQRSKVVAWQEAVQTMRDHGVKLGRPELCSEHWAQYGPMAPRLESGELHFSVLFIYDEHQQSDLIQDAVMEHSLLDHISVMFPPHDPAPWDDRHRYRADTLTVFFQTIDDRRMHEVDITEPFSSLLRSAQYVCPGFVPTFHVVPTDAPYAEKWRRGED
eukprot:TRINITY_DN5487_c0_g1_i1.p1 TRINITY_DN5487_c0_g1~~TRINITY_DN5487_c0_g1_i1.p1  ORF type:complete len:411 (+),score=164.31 TRINITY_DN5487_c0_g1_i1:76-1308(+)